MIPLTNHRMMAGMNHGWMARTTWHSKFIRQPHPEAPQKQLRPLLAMCQRVPASFDKVLLHIFALGCGTWMNVSVSSLDRDTMRVPLTKEQVESAYKSSGTSLLSHHWRPAGPKPFDNLPYDVKRCKKCPTTNIKRTAHLHKCLMTWINILAWSALLDASLCGTERHEMGTHLGQLILPTSRQMFLHPSTYSARCQTQLKVESKAGCCMSQSYLL